MRITARAILVLSSAVSPGLAVAGGDLLVPISQSRYIEGVVHADDLFTFLDDEDRIEATDFGPFSGTAQATVDDPSARADAGGWQDSEILPSGIVAKGSYWSTSESAGGLWIAWATARSDADVTFEVTQTVAYTLVGTVTSYDNGYAAASLYDASGQLIDSGYSGGDGEVAFSLSGTLDPGVYRLCVCTLAKTYASHGWQYDYGSGEYDVAFELAPPSGNYCQTSRNSFGPGATIGFSGSQSIAANDFVLEVQGSVPDQFGLFFYGPDQVQDPLGDGWLCIGGQLHRLVPALQPDDQGFAGRWLDFGVPPAGGGGKGTILPGSTWNFQWWYRDPLGGGSGSNLSDALWVTFCP